LSIGAGENYCYGIRLTGIRRTASGEEGEGPRPRGSAGGIAESGRSHTVRALVNQRNRGILRLHYHHDPSMEQGRHFASARKGLWQPSMGSGRSHQGDP